MDYDAIIDKLRRGGLFLREEEPMRAHTSFRIGGPVRAMVFPESEAEFELAARIVKGFGQSPIILGNGTNLLVTDAPLRRIAIKTHDRLGALRKSGENTIVSGSGLLLSRLAVFAMEQGLTGLEFAHGIPGTVGGAAFMNAGAYGGEMKDVVKKVVYLDENLDRRSAEGDALQFGYRRSMFSGTGRIILSAETALSPGDRDEIKTKIDELATRRRKSQPLNMPSGGSTFKRPETGYAAALIEGAGLKGFSIGGAQVSLKHAGFVVNRGNAAFRDVLVLIEHIQETVMRHAGVALEPEVKIITV